MSRKIWVSFSVVAVLLSVPAWAGEILHFTNGTTMEVESHTIDEGVVRVNLGGDSFMEFPLERIEKIENAYGEVTPLSDSHANQMLPSTNAAVQHGTAPRRTAREGVGNYATSDHIDVDDKGVAVYRPYITGPANKRRLGAAGRRELSHARSSNGTTRRGGRYVLPPKSTVARQSRTPIAIEKKK